MTLQSGAAAAARAPQLWVHFAIVVRFLCSTWLAGLAMTSILVLSVRLSARWTCCTETRDFAISLLFKISYMLFLRHFVESLQWATFLYLRALGASVDSSAVLTNLTVVKPQQASRLDFGPGSFVSVSVLDANRPDGKIVVGSDVLIGHSSYVKGNVSIETGAQVGVCTTLLDCNVPRFATVWGNRLDGPLTFSGKEEDERIERTFLRRFMDAIEEAILRVFVLLGFAISAMVPYVFYTTILPTADSLKFNVHFVCMAHLCLSSALIIYAFTLYVLLWITYHFLHPMVEGSWSVQSSVFKLWGAHHRVDIWARFVGLTFINGTCLASCWHRGLGARVGSDVLWLTGVVIDYSVLEVGDNAVIERDAVVSCHRVQRGALTIEKVNIGCDAVVRVGARLLGGNCIGDGCVLDFASHSHTQKSLPDHTEWAGSPAERADPRTTPSIKTDTAPFLKDPSETKSYGSVDLSSEQA